MKPVHIVTEEGKIASKVLMPGDPLRAKYIAEKFLENPELVNTVRNMYAYTGTYKGNRISVVGSGMGCPSIGIYSQELYQFYGVDKIIRIGTSGSMNPNVHVQDVALSEGSYSLSTFAYQFSRSTDHFIKSSENLNKTILDTAKELNMNVPFGPSITSDIFDVYRPIDDIIEASGYKDKLIYAEMEGFALFHVANVLGKEAAMLTTIVDSKYEPEVALTAEQREKNLNDMITLALEAIIK